MHTLNTTLVLFNLFLITLIICAYVKISYVIKQQGLQISVLLKQEKEGFKEALSPAQRWTMARKYRTSQNGLTPSWKQPTEVLPYMEAETNMRGDKPMSYLVRSNSGINITPEDAMKSGAGAIGGTTFDSSVSIPDTSALPAETQTGVIDTQKINPANFSTNPRFSPSFLETSTTFAPNEGSQERCRAKRRNE